MALECRMRLLEGKQLDNFLNSKKNIPNHILGSNPKLLVIDFEGTSTASETEMDPVSNKLQLDTAAALELVSSSADDNSSDSGHTQKVNAIVVDDSDEPTNKVLTLDDSDGTTVVTTSDKFKDVWHTYATSWGSGDLDAAGNIDVRKIDDTVICQIASGGTEGNGSGFMIPDNWLGALLEGYIQADGAQASDEGKQLKIYTNDEIDAETDVNVLNYVLTQIHDTTLKADINLDKILQSGTELTFFIKYLNAAGEDFFAHLEFLLWRK